ncbi:MAG: substrate-binding domain-containing protein [Clostridia bacterium]
MKKTLALVLTVLLTMTLFAGIASAEDGYKIGMLPKFKGENYFDGCYVGAQKAADELGVELVYDGPNQSEATNAKQVEILTGWLSAEFDAIVVSPCDAEGIAPTLREFKKKGVKVITFDADTVTDAREFYVNAATAKDIGVALVDVVAKGLTETGFGPEQPARLALISGSGLDVNQNEWILAMEAYIAETYSWLKINCDEVGYLGADIWTPGSDETAAQNAANESIALSGKATDGSQINAIIGTSSMSTPALAAAWNATVGEKPQVVITGLATPMGLVDYILDEENPMDYGVLWDVNNLGYLSVEAAVALLKGELVPAADITFASTMGEKQMVQNAEDGGLELLLGAALTFGPDTVESFNY